MSKKFQVSSKTIPVQSYAYWSLTRSDNKYSKQFRAFLCNTGKSIWKFHLFSRIQNSVKYMLFFLIVSLILSLLTTFSWTQAQTELGLSPKLPWGKKVVRKKRLFLTDFWVFSFCWRSEVLPTDVVWKNVVRKRHRLELLSWLRTLTKFPRWELAAFQSRLFHIWTVFHPIVLFHFFWPAFSLSFF